MFLLCLQLWFSQVWDDEKKTWKSAGQQTKIIWSNEINVLSFAWINKLLSNSSWTSHKASHQMHVVLNKIVYNAFTKWHRYNTKHDGSKALHLFQGRRFQGKKKYWPTHSKGKGGWQASKCLGLKGEKGR